MPPVVLFPVIPTFKPGGDLMRREGIGLKLVKHYPQRRRSPKCLTGNMYRLLASGRPLEPCRQRAGSEFDMDHAAMARRTRGGGCVEQKRPHEHDSARLDCARNFRLFGDLRNPVRTQPAQKV